MLLQVWLLTVDDEYTTSRIFYTESDALEYLWREYGTAVGVQKPTDLAEWAAGDDDTGQLAPGVSATWDYVLLDSDKLSAFNPREGAA